MLYDMVDLMSDHFSNGKIKFDKAINVFIKQVINSMND